MDSFILESENLLSSEVCQDLIDQFEKHTWLHVKGKVGIRYEDKMGGELRTESEFKQSTDLGITDAVADSPAFQPLILNLFEFLNTNISAYKEKYIHLDAGARWGMTERFNIQRYRPGEGYYAWHTEYHPNIAPTNRRVLAWMIYLNDVKDAGTEFANFGKIDAVQGKCLIWPAYWTHTHRGIVSDSETKYIATGWYSYLDF
jgi:prolyl 4-hydroxylase